MSEQKTPNAQRPTPNGEWVPVPVDIAKCPECGAQLEVSIDGWAEGKGYNVQLNCPEDDNESHFCCQGDWQPVEDAVATWVNTRKPVTQLSNHRMLFQVQLVGGAFDGSTSICSGDRVWKGKELYIRSTDDRYHFTPQAGGRN